MTQRLSCLLVLSGLLAARSWAVQVQQHTFEKTEDYLTGELEGLAVDSAGAVRLARATTLLMEPAGAYVWALAADRQGRVYVGTGNDGKVFEVQDGQGRLFYDAAELGVHALAVGPDDRVYLATSPAGQIWTVDRAGHAEAFFDPPDRYIWAVAFDPAGNLWVAAGIEGHLYRVDRAGHGELVFTSSEAHLTSLAIDEQGTVYVGSAPSGVVYRVSPKGEIGVLCDTAFREVKAIALGPDRVVYAALVETSRDKEEALKAVPPPAAAVTPGTPEVTVTEAFSLSPLPVSPLAGATAGETPGAAKGALIKVQPTGEIETLWTSTEEMPHALAIWDQTIWMGTGSHGRLYRVRDAQSWSMEEAFGVDQVTALLPSAQGLVLATSNPARVYQLGAIPAAKGTFTSTVRDSGVVSNWGRLSWEGGRPPGSTVESAARCGNLGTPDASWSGWAPPSAQGVTVCPASRFVQVRLTLRQGSGSSPEVSRIELAYQQRNLSPQVSSLTVYPPGEAYQRPMTAGNENDLMGLSPGEVAALAAGASTPAPTPQPGLSLGRKTFQKGLQTVSWKADDPNGDQLTYEVHYRLASAAAFHVLRRDLTDPYCAWDTTTLPNGRYILRILASDALSNPPGLALSGERVSEPFLIDNTPPTISLQLLGRRPLRLRAVVKDEDSTIRKVEYSLDGAGWLEVYPRDGLDDSPEESYELALDEPQPAGSLVIRAADALGNRTTQRADLAPAR